MHYKQKYIYIGLDLHKRSHTAVAIDYWNERLFELQMENKPAAFQALLDEAKKHVKEGITPIFGLEDTGGYGRSLAVFLLEKGQKVKEVNSALSHSERKATQPHRKATVGMPIA